MKVINLSKKQAKKDLLNSVVALPNILSRHWYSILVTTNPILVKDCESVKDWTLVDEYQEKVLYVLVDEENPDFQHSVESAKLALIEYGSELLRGLMLDDDFDICQRAVTFFMEENREWLYREQPFFYNAAFLSREESYRTVAAFCAVQ